MRFSTLGSKCVYTIPVSPKRFRIYRKGSTMRFCFDLKAYWIFKKKITAVKLKLNFQTPLSYAQWIASKQLSRFEAVGI